jgi:hypothetical protein
MPVSEEVVGDVIAEMLIPAFNKALNDEGKGIKNKTSHSYSSSRFELVE